MPRKLRPVISTINGHEPWARSEQGGRDTITAAARRKQFDDLVVAKCDDEDGRRRGQCEKQRKRRVMAERKKRFFGTVTGRRQAIRAETHPGEERRDSDRLACARIQGIERLSDDPLPHLVEGGHGVSRWVQVAAISSSEGGGCPSHREKRRAERADI
jgi:hypothetical protein